MEDGALEPRKLKQPIFDAAAVDYFCFRGTVCQEAGKEIKRRILGEESCEVIDSLIVALSYS